MDRRGQQAEYERALERAQARGIDVEAIGYGHDGTRYWFVPSATEPNGDWHRVWIDDGHFHCTCQGGTYDKLCMHKAVARRQYIEEERAQQRPKRQPEPHGRVVTFDGRGGRGSKCAACGAAFAVGEQVRLSDSYAYHNQCGATAAPGADAPLIRSNAPISIFK